VRYFFGSFFFCICHVFDGGMACCMTGGDAPP
jgi:hypothetical protein